MSHRMPEIIPDRLISKKECQEMIDAAMRKHNRNASLISIALGTIALIGYADGMIRILERIQ